MKNYISCLITSILLGTFCANGAVAASIERPNLVVIVVDDQRFDELGSAGHPYLQTPNMDQLAREGVRFSSTYATTPLCSPNRASILTGQYASRHGIIDNVARDNSSKRLPLFAKDLQKAGYETAHIGKWHMGNDPTPRPGYDYWVGLPGQGRSTNPLLFEEGRVHQVEGYLTDILTDRAVDFIRRDRDQPFFMYIGHKAAHPDLTQREDGSVDPSKPMKFVAAPRHVGLYKNEVFPQRKNTVLTAEQLARKPVIQEALLRKAELYQASFQHSENSIRDRAEMLLAVDEGLGRIVSELKQLGILDNTAILFTSDNGYWYGEHGLSVERRMPYEEGVRVPMLLRYPNLATGGQTIDQFTLSIDIAPTMLALAGAEIGGHIQGMSLTRLFSADGMVNANTQWRNSFMMEYFASEKPMDWLTNAAYKSVRMGNYKYIRWIQHEGKDELYDLDQDPYELENRVDDPRLKTEVKQLKGELARLVAAAVGLD